MHDESNIFKLVKVPIQIKSVQINQLKINYAVGGKGDPLLLLHGANIGWGQWYPNIDALARYFKLYMIDLPGAGESTKIDYRTAQFQKIFVDVVSEFIKNNHLERANIIAHSVGAAIAIKLVAQEKIVPQKIILESPMGFSDYIPLSFKPITLYPLAKLISSTALKLTRQNMKSFLLSVMKQKKKLKEEFVDYYYNSITKGGLSHPLIFMNSLTKNFKVKQEILINEDLKKVNSSILIIMGENDPLVPLDRVQKGIKNIDNIQLKIVAHVGHVPSIENSDYFNDQVLQFLRS